MVKIINKDIQPFYFWNQSCHDLPVVINIPHSGLYIDRAMNDKMFNHAILPNTDWYLPELYNFLEELGFTVIINNINRHLIDVNRDINGKGGNSYKTNAIYPKTTQNKALYLRKLSDEDKKQRIEDYYLPYHQAIKQAIKEKQKYFKKVYLIDLHSFGLNHDADIILGNDYDQTCSISFISFFKKNFENNGLSVVENYPFAGGYITKYYGKEIVGCEAIQIELWYQSYIEKRRFLNEELPEINKELFLATQDKLKNVFISLKNKLIAR